MIANFARSQAFVALFFSFACNCSLKQGDGWNGGDDLFVPPISERSIRAWILIETFVQTLVTKEFTQIVHAFTLDVK